MLVVIHLEIINEFFYLLVEKVRKHTDWLNTPSWKDMKGYSSARINAGLLQSLAEDMLGPVYGPVLIDD